MLFCVAFSWISLFERRLEKFKERLRTFIKVSLVLRHVTECTLDLWLLLNTFVKLHEQKFFLINYFAKGLFLYIVIVRVKELRNISSLSSANCRDDHVLRDFRMELWDFFLFHCLINLNKILDDLALVFIQSSFLLFNA